jgi:hypothetical protein
MSSKNIFSMLNFAKKIAQNEDPDNFAYESTGVLPEEEQFGLAKEETPFTGEQGTGTLGFSAMEIEKIKGKAKARGLLDNFMPLLLKLVNSINEEVNSGIKDRNEAYKEIETYITKIIDFQNQKSGIPQQPAETGQETSTEEGFTPETEENLGFTEIEISDIENKAREQGLKERFMPTLSALIDSVNEDIKSAITGKTQATKEIEAYLADLLKTQETQKPASPAPTENVGEVDNILGFTPYEIEQMEDYSVEKGLNTEYLPQLDEIIDEVNEKINNSTITKQDGIEEINVRAKQLLELQNKNKPTAPDKTEDEINEELASSAEENEIPETEYIEEEPEITEPEITEPAVPTGVAGPENSEEAVEEEDKGITPEQAAETAKNIKLSETPEDYENEDVSKYPVAYEKGGRVMAPQNKFRVTPQAEKMLEVFGKENIVRNPMFAKAVGWADKGLRLRYYIQDIPREEIAATLYRNIMNAMSIRERYDPRDDTSKDAVDYRLKIYVDTPELVPPEMQQEWQTLQGYFKQELQRRQEESIAKGKDPQKQLYDVTQSSIIAKSGFASKFIANLNKLINSGDPRVLDPIYKEAASLTAYELGHRERGDKPMPQMIGEGGESQDVTELGLPQPKEKMTENIAVPFKQNQSSFRKSSEMATDFMDNVWASLGESTQDPSDYAKTDKIRLKLELFKQQAKKLFGEDQDSYETAKDRVYNNDGKVIWNSDPQEVAVRQPDGTMKVVKLESQMKDIVSKKAFYDNYINFLKFKFNINQIAATSGANVNTPEGVASIRNAVSAQDPNAKNPAFVAFLNDPKFIKMTAGQDQSEIMAEYQRVSSNPKQAGLIDESFRVIWGELAADALIAVAKKTKQLQTELASKNEVERSQAIDNFIRARQNFISFIGVRPGLLDDTKESAKLGTNSKLKRIFKLSLSAREIMQMIAGYKPIPATIMDALSSHKYQAALKIYNNMLYKLAKLEKIKLASVNVPKNIIENIISTAQKQIDLIMES